MEQEIEIEVLVAGPQHEIYVDTIIDTIAEAAKEVADFKPTNDTVQAIGNVFKCLNPLYGLSVTDSVIVGEGEDVKAIAKMDDFTFYSGIASNLAYSAAFFFGGACLFKKRDVK